ncbi:MAG TPA: 2-oxoacid:acceptor oxidoreductase family protein [Jiangellaceae bacterium]|nr:2-oxoacid:acceptor oxidoreductase family protein [Jiangellaceae bacterium]
MRIHGRGGQGVVTAAEMLSVAAFVEGRHAQAFPSFGSERTGAPVVAFCRIGDVAIRTHEPVTRPDVLIIQDVTLLHQVDVFEGLRPSGYVLLNTAGSLAELGIEDLEGSLPPGHVASLPATELAMNHIGRPVPNAALLGGFAALTRLVSLDSVQTAIRARFPERLAESNIAAARDAYRFVSAKMEELTSA